jgi:hypothetical protein
MPFALLAIIAIGAAYLAIIQGGVPRAGGTLGHSLGVVGFLIMLSTETLYSLRKRLRKFTWGQMNTWLQWHVVTGLVGPFLVLLHTGWKFNGLAGILTLLTFVMVASGLVGRYIYTAVPRTLDGTESGGNAIQEQIAAIDRQLALVRVEVLSKGERAPRRRWAAVLGRPWLRWRQKQRLRKALARVPGVGENRQLQGLLRDRYRLQLQVDSLPQTRRLLALWHLFHMPLGVVVFSLAFIHVGAALYYATLMK